jgi:hypothetical protein
MQDGSHHLLGKEVEEGILLYFKDTTQKLLIFVESLLTFYWLERTQGHSYIQGRLINVSIHDGHIPTFRDRRENIYSTLCLSFLF